MPSSVTKDNLAKVLCRGQEAAIILGGKLNPPFGDDERIRYLLKVIPYGLHGKLPDNDNPKRKELLDEKNENIDVLSNVFQLVLVKSGNFFAPHPTIGFHANEKDLNLCFSNSCTAEKLKKATLTSYFVRLNHVPLIWKPGDSIKLEFGFNLLPHANISNTFLIKAADIREHPKGSKEKATARGLVLWKVVIDLNGETLCESAPFIRGNGGDAYRDLLSNFLDKLQGKKSSKKRKKPAVGSVLLKNMKLKEEEENAAKKMKLQSDAFEFELNAILNPPLQQTNNIETPNGDVSSSDVSVGKHTLYESYYCVEESETSPNEQSETSSNEEFADELLRAELLNS